MLQMEASPITFGTDGWRARIADTYTFTNVRACVRAVADHFAETQGTDAPLVVGHDTRFLSPEFALESARVLAAAGFRVQLATQASPTPAASLRIVQEGAGGGVVITSSHNPFNWNGVKVKPHYGGSASPEIVADIEARIPAILASADGPPTAAAGDARIEHFDPIPGYIETLSKLVDIDRIRDAGLRIAVDPMYGTGAGLFQQLVGGGKSTVHEVHSERNPLFPGIRAPEPIASNLGELMGEMRGGGFDVGIAVDGDSDRVGLLDEQGNFIDQLRTFALLTHYLLGERGERGAVVKSLTTTDMARLLAEHYDVPFFETPVGFKYIGPLMMEHDALIGGEESGGYGFRGHLPERDGILAGLMLLDYVARTGKRPSELLADMFAITGPHFYKRVDIELEAGANDAVRERLDAADPVEVAGHAVVSSDRVDGWRFHIDEGWLLLRLSGTEPLVRVYTEVRDEALVEPVLAAGKKLAGIG